jgi:hypothetical protein
MIKIVVCDNGNLHRPEEPGLWRRREGDGALRSRCHDVTMAGGLEDSIKTWLAQPSPAFLRVKVNPMHGA